jgi:hypothetical protein
MVKQFDHYLDNIQFILLSILVKLGPFFVALTPALFTFWAVFILFLKSLAGDKQPSFLIFCVAFFFGLVPAFSIEAVGIVVVHTASDLWDYAERGKTTKAKFWLMTALIPFYVLGVALVVGLSGDTFPPLVKNLGIASPFLTVIVYTAVSLNRSLLNVKLQIEEDKALEGLKIEESKGLVKEKAKADWELEKEKTLLIVQLKHEEKLKKLELKSQGQVSEVKNRTLVKEENKAKLLLILSQPFDVGANKHTVEELSQKLSVSRVTVYTYMEELVGKVKYNGNGVELVKEELKEF